MHRHHHTNRRSITKALSETALVLVLLGVAAGMWVGRPAYRRSTESTANALSRTSPFAITGTPTAPPPPTTGGVVRRIYGHSLVAGGIHSIDELMAAIQRDPLLAKHYKNFDLSKAHIITLDHDVVAYVSYRLGRAIYWEAKPTIIAKGEQVITDGTNFIRTRCGNRIAYSPGFPTSPEEPEDINTVVEVKLVEPPGSAGPTTGNLTNPTSPSPTLADPSTTSAGNLPGSPAPPVPGGSLPPISPWGIGGGGSTQFNPPLPPSNPPSQFSADEFSTISFTILGHSCNIPSEAVALLAGILIVVAIRLALWR